jgi:hypothetical protein
VYYATGESDFSCCARYASAQQTTGFTVASAKRRNWVYYGDCKAAQLGLLWRLQSGAAGFTVATAMRRNWVYCGDCKAAQLGLLWRLQSGATGFTVASAKRRNWVYCGDCKAAQLGVLWRLQSGAIGKGVRVELFCASILRQLGNDRRGVRVGDKGDVALSVRSLHRRGKSSHNRFVTFLY